MKKTRTTHPHPVWRLLRRGLAVFLAVMALWLVWLTGDPAAALDELTALAADAEVATSLLAAELGTTPEEGGLSPLDKLVLAQSSLLSGTLPDPEPTLSPPPTAAPSPSYTAPPEFNDEDDDPLPPSATAAPDGVISKTLKAGTSAKYITVGNVSVYNRTDYTVDLAPLLDSAPRLTKGEGPQILIYHSHATEAYHPDGNDVYEPSGDHRTLDTNFNMVRVGEEMKEVFEAAGFQVIHDETLYDYPNYNNSYSRSAEGVSKWLEQYPTLTLILDVHRDALAATDGTIYKTAVGTVDNCAQVMMVMGTDDSGAAHPNWKVNLSLALAVQKRLTDKWATLARPIVLRPTRFNQQLSTGMLLVEVGTHGNTLQEALTAARLYARTVVELFNAP